MMRNQVNILHISDFHCKKGDRNGGFAWKPDALGPYIERLKACFAKAGAPRGAAADIIIHTGNVVHQCDDAFDIATDLIRLIQSRFAENNICPDVFLCTGNHDYDRCQEQNGIPHLARLGYKRLELKFHEEVLSRSINRSIHEQFKRTLGEGDFGDCEGVSLLYPADRTSALILSLDTTWKPMENSGHAKEYGTELYKPQPWYSDEKRSVLWATVAKSLKELRRDIPLLILSHYPVDVPQELRDRKEHDMDAHHAKFVRGLLARLCEDDINTPILVFSGDIHQATKLTEPGSDGKRGIFHFIAGRFYQSFGEDSAARYSPSARMISVRRPKQGWRGKAEIVRSIIAQYQSNGPGFDPTRGDWVIVRNDSDRIPSTWRNSVAGFSRADSLVLNPSSIEGSNTPEGDSENLLLEALEDRGMVELRRVRCGEDGGFDRLVHINVGPLFSLNEVREYCITQVRRTIEDKTQSAGMGLLLGVDCWGQAIAFRVAAETGTYAHGMSIRGLEVNEIAAECEGTLRCAREIDAKWICIVTDVISTGQTVGNLGDRLRASIKTEVFAAGLIRSKWSSREGRFLEKMTTHFIVSDFEMPIVRADSLPSIMMLPDSD